MFMSSPTRVSVVRCNSKARIQSRVHKSMQILGHHRGLSSQAHTEDLSSSPRGVAIVTGASRGIGKAIALPLASDGYDIGLNDLPSSRDALEKVSQEIQHVYSSGKNTKGKTLLYPVDSDVSAEEDVKAMVRMCVDELGGIDVFAIRGLTQAAALEWAAHGITVNAYAPGPIETDMFELITKRNETTKVEGISLQTAVGFLGRPEDVAGLVSYLASEDARYITGQAYTIDGGIIFD